MGAAEGRDAAEHLLAEKVRERQHPGVLSPDRDITLGEYKVRWLAMVASEINPRTLKSYTQLLTTAHRPCVQPCPPARHQPRNDQALPGDEVGRGRGQTPSD